jgi:hypothetical protein
MGAIPTVLGGPATMRRFMLSAVTCVVFWACGGATGLGDSAPRLGRYTYSLTLPLQVGVTNERRYTGAMIVSFASKDSIAGSWDVPTVLYPAFPRTDPGLQTRMALGFKNAGAYVVYAYPMSGGTITHRLTPTKSGFVCDAGFLYGTGGGGFARLDASLCTLTYAGP